MSDDILDRIDEVMARNARRFDPFGASWDDPEAPEVEPDTETWVPVPDVAAGPAGVPLSPMMAEAVARQPRCERCNRFTAVPVEVCDVCRVPPASPWLTREDLCGRPDRVGDLFRAEVLRQGLASCEIDGVPWEYRNGAWKQVEALRLDGVPPPAWGPVTDIADAGPPLTVTMRQARSDPSREIRALVEGEEVFRGTAEPWPDDVARPARRPWWKRLLP